jgi:hypothetical protein
MDVGSNERNYEKLKPRKEAEVSVSQGEEKLKSIRNMIYLLLGKIDSRCCKTGSCRSWRLTKVSTIPTRFSGVSRLGFS